MDRRLFLAAVAALLSLPRLAQAATAADAQKFIDSLGESTVTSLTDSSLSEAERVSAACSNRNSTCPV
jgi:hypothetical protein